MMLNPRLPLFCAATVTSLASTGAALAADTAGGIPK